MSHSKNCQLISLTCAGTKYQKYLSACCENIRLVFELAAINWMSEWFAFLEWFSEQNSPTLFAFALPILSSDFYFFFVSTKPADKYNIGFCECKIFLIVFCTNIFLHVGQKYLRAMGPKLPCLAPSHSAALAGTLHHIGDPDKIGIVQYKDFI